MKLTPILGIFASLDLLAYFQFFWKRKWAALFIVNCAVIATTIHIFWIADEVYAAQATIMYQVINSCTFSDAAAPSTCGEGARIKYAKILSEHLCR